jgi:D-amino-acid dehydrogenase
VLLDAAEVADPDGVDRSLYCLTIVPENFVEAGMRVVVAGGGVIGLTTAYDLARAGAEVVVVDARGVGLGASAVNAGWFVPAESMPVPGPDVVAQSLRWMVRRDSPVYIRPSLDPRFLSFLVGMWRHSNARDQRAGFEAHLRLARDTARVLDEYRADGIDFEMHGAGLLMAFAEKENLEHHRAHLDLVRQFDLDPRVLVGDDVRAHEPLLSDRVHGGIFFPHERHLDPRALVDGLHKRLLGLGVRVIEDDPVTGVTVNAPSSAMPSSKAGHDRRITALVTTTRLHEGDAFVLAAGAWTGRLSAAFGHRLPVRPGKGYSIDVPPVPLRSATNLSDAKVAVTPFTDRLRLAGTMEFAGLDENVNDLRVRAILRAPAGYLRDWEPPSGPLQPRAGMRPMTPDGLAVIGRLPGTSNAYVSSGHGMLGVTLAAGSARALSELIISGAAPPPLAPFDPARFQLPARRRLAVRAGRTHS